MAWDDNLNAEQIHAASQYGTHARLLSGPGTGKTTVLVRRVEYLVSELGIASETILGISFTRAATANIRKSLEEHLEPLEIDVPKVMTLHGFALRQILRNGDRMRLIPQPVHVADDWEEHNIIEQDLRRSLDWDVRKVRKAFNQLSNDFESLRKDDANWEVIFSQDYPEFVGAWTEHRTLFGYTLRSEMVYQVKIGLENDPDFILDSDYNHLLIDEYQDLNSCDLSVVKSLVERGLELYAIGDDDQSIYGFRGALPEGIRNFTEEYPGSQHLDLETCHRCDCNIMDVGRYIARLDPRRIDRRWVSRDAAPEGEVQLYSFRGQAAEADGVARICQHIHDEHGIPYDGILILLRSNPRQIYSRRIAQSLEEMGIPNTVMGNVTNPLDEDTGREILAILRLANNSDDSLAMRTLIKIRPNRIGEGTIQNLIELGRVQGLRFGDLIRNILDDPEIQAEARTQVPTINTVINEARQIIGIVDECKDLLLTDDDFESTDEFIEVFQEWMGCNPFDIDAAEGVIDYLISIIRIQEIKTLSDLILSLSSTMGDKEQDIKNGMVNILTMHQAKGLTADAVIIPVAEDEVIPRNAVGRALGDERRLLYVSLTRARHHLFITYCNQRTGEQQHYGARPGVRYRSLTQFLARCPSLRVENGEEGIGRLSH